ncbi:Rv2231c family pyridoxal phosphate-dependent protein CobC [Asanoa sp. WMMD1127]|uniref:Rv2231c family pyridoxal phosphate-dependent protein CobC n=1 Tax=Asanoa sp. WMMD1127 TaxID=3016107 RepID=UPI002417E086|nr:Rv2231c family pyridoxal phosphate-dependent protein CobC [Asanoa sp. WMMD1127]MDG4820320.1 Rv2231c family pyridoxal phosphate-dependent protein CobC [Asanoa sp. WMMD1127]
MIELGHHGDAEVGPGLVDLAVNVRQAPLPPWLSAPVAASLASLGAYPDPGPARAAVAARHGRSPSSVLLTAGAAQAFVLIAQAYRGASHAVVVHPQFTEPEAALLAAGHTVDRVVLPPPYTLSPALVPDSADLVFVGNPTNPTSVLHPAAVLASLARPGRLLVLDEAFADTVPGEPASLAGLPDVPGLVVVRSLTKTWALAGLRIGYVLAPPPVIARLSAVQPLWPVSTPALAAATACASPVAVAAERSIAISLAADRAHLLARLADVPGVAVAAPPASSFVLLRMPNADKIRLALRDAGYAVRRGDTFPGLGPDFVRVAVRDLATTDAFVDALAAILRGGEAAERRP